MNIHDEPLMLGHLRVGCPMQDIRGNDNDIPLFDDHRPVFYKKSPFARHQIENFVGTVKMVNRHIVT
ncbi:hypothetical protein D3C86_2025150 [compost metagenome]